MTIYIIARHTNCQGCGGHSTHEFAFLNEREATLFATGASFGAGDGVSFKAVPIDVPYETEKERRDIDAWFSNGSGGVRVEWSDQAYLAQ